MVLLPARGRQRGEVAEPSIVLGPHHEPVLRVESDLAGGFEIGTQFVWAGQRVAEDWVDVEEPVSVVPSGNGAKFIGPALGLDGAWHFANFDIDTEEEVARVALGDHPFGAQLP